MCYYLKTLSLLFFFISCSTQKDAALNRFYHQLNTKYNAIFYADQHLQEGIKKIKEAHEDNYKELLTIHQQVPKNVQTVQTDLDRAIEKATVAIKKHSMDIEGVEKNKLIDDAYLIIGQAKFYKKEYTPAINTFNYIVRSSNNVKIQTDAALWSAHCLFQQDNFEVLARNLQIIDEEYFLNKAQQAVFFEIKADLAIASNDFTLAKTLLLNTVSLTRSKEKKTRIFFILGQLSLLTNEYKDAYDYFKEVIKKNPEYEMVFNAKLNQTKTTSFDKDSFEKLSTELEKMILDKKNKEYRDQIYFALGNMQLVNLDTISAISSLENSAKFSLYNEEQKIESHYLLAGIFWTNKEYIKSYNHCDSAYRLLNSENLKYEEIKNMRKNSKMVADYYRVITVNDSLINLATLPVGERNKIIDDYIETLREKEESLKLVEKTSSGSTRNFNSYEYNKQTQNSLNITSTGGWYFYNASAMSLGYSEFISRWGNRKLEDNWRRKNKSSTTETEEFGLTSNLDEPDEKEKYSREYYISNLPLTEQQQQELESDIETAYYYLAKTFKEELRDYHQAIKLYQELLIRYPKTDYKKLAYFDLYKIYHVLPYPKKQEEVFSLIKELYPTITHLEILTGKGTVVGTQVLQDSIYRKAYSLYSDFSSTSCDSLKELLSSNLDHPQVSKIELLNLFCKAQNMTKMEFVSGLNHIKTTHSNSPILEKLDSLILTLTGEIDNTLETEYENEFETPHYFFLLLTEVSINLPETQRVISIFNDKNYRLDSLRVTNLLLNKQEQILRVQEFTNKTKALAYYYLIQDDPESMNILGGSGVQMFIISQNNFIQLLRQKNINSYIEYFNTIYLLNSN